MFNINQTTEIILKFESSNSENDNIYAEILGEEPKNCVDLGVGENKEYFKELLGLILTKEVKKNFEQKNIRKQLRNIINESFNYDDESKRKENILNNLNELNHYLTENIEREYTFLVPLDNLTIENKIKLGKVEIGTYDDFIEDVNNNITVSGEELPNFILKDFSKNLIYAKIKRKGVPKFSLIDVYNEIRLVLSILNFFKRESELPIVISKELNRDIMYFFAYSTNNYYSETKYLNDTRYCYDLNSKRLNSFKPLLTLLNEIINKENKTDIENRILKSIFFYNEANLNYLNKVDDFYYSNEGMINNLKYNVIIKSFLFLFTSLETLLVNSNREVTARVSSRSSRLVYDDYNKRKILKNDIKNLYKKRSDLIHDGNNNVNIKEFRFLRCIVKNSIYAMTYSYKFKSLVSDEDLSNFFIELNKNNKYIEELKNFKSQLDP